MISLSISSTSLRPCSRCATERRGGVEESKAPTMARAPLRSASLPSTTVSTTSLRTFAPRVDETTSSKDFRSSSPSGAEAYSSSIDLQRFSTRFAAHSSAAGLPFGASFCRMRTGALPPWTWDWAPPRTSCELPPPPENFCWAAICRSRACCRCWSRAWDWSAPCEDPPRCCCCCCCGAGFAFGCAPIFEGPSFWWRSRQPLRRTSMRSWSMKRVLEEHDLSFERMSRREK
mmetsp:Transcript_23131/g.79053  ORF Transcript_23131/g.79053 Transcript_23131/m.79053 type:complete len:231 (-) Transcript_23131:1214-1906(-)